MKLTIGILDEIKALLFFFFLFFVGGEEGGVGVSAILKVVQSHIRHMQMIPGLFLSR